MSLLQSILMGLIQGLTEFLPVSSSGHLAIFKILFDVNTETGLLFDVMLHVGTLVAICIVYYKDIVRLVIEFVGMLIDGVYNLVTWIRKLRGKDGAYRHVIYNSYRKMVMLVIVSTIPTGIIGYVGADLVTAASEVLIVPGICLIITAALLFVSNYLVNYAIGRSGDGGDREVALEVEASPDSVEAIIETNRAQYSADIDAFAAAHPGENVTLTAADGLTLHGVRYANAETADTHRWAIVLHGYRGDHTGVLNLAMPYYEAGYQVIAPDLRACGDSDGDYVGMGWLDREDILRWIDFILADDPQAEIVVHGISMGAATTMMTAGEDTPENVKVFIEDCGYTSVWDVFSSELQLRFGLPEFPILYTASGVAKLRAGYTFGEASALRQVENCEKPMLFIHGTADDFIPYEMMDELYNAKPGDNKAELTADGAGHGEAMYALGDTYWDTVFDFIEPYMN